MVEQRYAGFRELERRAHEELMLVGNQPSEAAQAFVFGLSVCPTFGNPVTWNVWDGVSQIVRQVIWNKLSDSERFSDPLAGLRQGWHTVPTIEAKVFPVERTVFDGLLTSIRQIRLPCYESTGIVLDGTSWRVKVAGCFDDQTVSWIGHDEEMREIRYWVLQVYELLAKAGGVQHHA
jgi:hypothetical protein